MPDLKQKLSEWLRRYGPAEVVSLACTLGGGFLARCLDGSAVAQAISATWCGNIGYFGTILWQDVRATSAYLKREGRPYTRRVFYKNIRALVVEFGIAEVLDSLLIRPFLLYKMPQLTGSAGWGLIAGKFLADITFYIPSAIFYELSKKRLRKF